MMKQFLLIALAFFILSGCRSSNEKKANLGELDFEQVHIQSNILEGTAELKADLKQQILSLNIKLENNSNTYVTVEDIDLETTEGFQAKLIGQDLKPFIINAGDDTTIQLQFKPINDFELYTLTGESGKFKPMYNFSIVCKDESLIKAQFNVLKEGFAEYEKNYRPTAVAYKFNNGTDFTEKQKKYLNPFLNISPFVNLSNQEIAIAGLNFRLQSYQRGDSLHAKVFIVNHAEFPIKIDYNAFDVIDNVSTIADEDSKAIRFKKISGPQEEANILRKGDRAMISLSKLLKGKTRNLSITFKETFFIQNDKSLFYANPELVKL